MPAITIGVFTRVYGVNGAIKVYSFSGETKHFRKLKYVEIRKDDAVQTVLVHCTAIQNKTPILKIEGVDTPESAKRYVGYQLWVPREQAVSLCKGEYYASDMINVKVRVGNSIVGTVRAIIDGAQAPLLEIERGRKEKTSLVPFMDVFIGKVNIPRDIEVKAPWIFG